MPVNTVATDYVVHRHSAALYICMYVCMSKLCTYVHSFLNGTLFIKHIAPLTHSLLTTARSFTVMSSQRISSSQREMWSSCVTSDLPEL